MILPDPPATDVSRALLASRDAVASLRARRRVLKWLGGAGGALLATSRLRAAPVAACPVVAEETAGPFPADGSRFGGGGPPGMAPGFGPGPGPGPHPGVGPGGPPPGPPPGGPNGSGAGTGTPVDMLDARLIRADIRADTDGTHVRPGVPLALSVTVRDATGCAPLAGVYVYIWHCCRDGHYSGYRDNGGGPGANAGAGTETDFTARTFLRGVQPTDASGTAHFSTVYPGRYQGRATHIHAVVFPAGAAPAFDPALKLATTQFAFPDDVNERVYAAAEGYAANRRRGTPANAADGIFADGTDTERLTIAGDPATGYAARIDIALAVATHPVPSRHSP